MDANIRRELAIEILNFERESNQERLVLLRGADDVLNGDFRDIDIYAKYFNPKKFITFLESKSFLVVKIVRRYHFYQYSVVHSSHDEILLIDIWTLLHYRGIPYFKNFSPNIVMFENLFFTLDPVQSLTIACVKCLTQTGEIKEKYLARLDDYKLDLKEITKRTILHERTVSTISLAYMRILWLCFFIRYIISKKLLVIYLLGPDGAGKTTISDRLLSSEVRAKKVYYHGRIPVLPRIQVIAGAAPKKVEYTDTKKRKFTVFHTFYYIIDALLSRVFLNLIFWQDKLILCDRTHYDIIARETYRNVPRIFQKLLIRSLFRPDYCFLLYCAPNEINQRKPELPASEIESQYIAYRANHNLLQFREISTSKGSHSTALIASEINDELLSNR